MQALGVERLARPRLGQHVECLVEQRVALVEVDAEGEELGLVVAGADPEDEPALRDNGRASPPLLASRNGLRYGTTDRWVSRLDALGHRGGEREADERVEGLVTAVGEPVGAGDRVLGERERVEAGLPRPPPRRR